LEAEARDADAEIHRRARAVGDLFDALMPAHQVRGDRFARVTALAGIHASLPPRATHRPRSPASRALAPSRRSFRIVFAWRATSTPGPARRGRVASQARGARAQRAQHGERCRGRVERALASCRNRAASYKAHIRLIPNVDTACIRPISA
jgi:hypothetical protein